MPYEDDEFDELFENVSYLYIRRFRRNFQRRTGEKSASPTPTRSRFYSSGFGTFGFSWENRGYPPSLLRKKQSRGNGLAARPFPATASGKGFLFQIKQVKQPLRKPSKDRSRCGCPAVAEEEEVSTPALSDVVTRLSPSSPVRRQTRATQAAEQARPDRLRFPPKPAHTLRPCWQQQDENHQDQQNYRDQQ